MATTDGGAPAPAPIPRNGSYRTPLPRRPAPILAPAESVATREMLNGELAGITSAEQLTDRALTEEPCPSCDQDALLKMHRANSYPA
jgi:hypothetical protein